MIEQSRQEHHKMELVFTHPSGVDESCSARPVDGGSYSNGLLITRKPF